ncbi:MAG: hypothetical protein PHE89_05925 [Alphaproteobacteria bacterium]|nr:hypothetical protein [Alphaproteobacteria bacterium]
MTSDTPKVIKKIKIKKPIARPLEPSIDDIIKVADSNDDEITFENLFGEETYESWQERDSLSEQQEKNEQEESVAEEEEDEFDQLLREFIHNDFDTTEELKDIRASLEDYETQQEIKLKDEKEVFDSLNEEEKALFDAYRNFASAINDIAKEANEPKPKFSINPSILYPKYKPVYGRKLAKDTLLGWDLMLKVHPARISSIEPTATDEELLDFAEKTTDDNLQLAIISYVEILIEIESCEIMYEKKKIEFRRKRVEREIFMEHKRREEKTNKYISEIKKQKFPIDAEKLVKNFFKTSQKDAQGAFIALTTSPAIFSPIDFSKIKPRLFGLIKVTPQDGIKINKKIGNFLKYLRV